MRKSLLLALLLALAATPLLATELLQNTGFETGQLGPWYQARDFCNGTCVNWNASAQNPHTGTYSAMDEGNIELRQDFAATPGSQITNASFWVYTDSGVDAVDFFYTDSSDEEFVVFAPANTWTLENVTADVNKGKTLMGFSIWGSGPNHITFVDDADLTAVPEPGSLVLLGSGLVGLAGLARRRLSL